MSTRAIVEAQSLRLIRLALLVGALYVLSLTTVDPDLWGHVIFGRDIVTQGTIQTIDPYSFTSNRLWINHEWLSEVLLFLAFNAGGSLGIVAIKTVVAAGVVMLMLGALKRAHLKPIHHDLLMAIALAVMIARIHAARPQVFSLLLFGLLLHAITAADRGEKRWLLVIPVGMALWSNLHGGFIVGLGVLFLWLLVRLLQAEDLKSKSALVGVALLSVGATLLNPYGFRLWQFLGSTVGLSRAHVTDWQPILSLNPMTSTTFVIATIVCVYMIVRAGTSLDWAYRLIVAALFLGTVRVGRFDAFFAIAMVMLVAPALRSRLQSVPRADGQAASAFGYRVAFLCAATVVLTTGVVYGVKSGRCIESIDAPESAAVDFFKANPNHARVLTWFSWGEYAIWHLGSDILVSIDGRRETVYSEDLFEGHIRVYQNGPDAPMFVRRLAPDFVWLPSNEPVVNALVADGWHTRFRGPVSTILGKDPGTALQDQTHSGAFRCFPEP